jgi:RNA recognition motif-containing protein
MPNKTLYVGNFPYDTTEADLRQLFQQFEPLAEVRIMGNRGFAFVELDEQNAEAAIAELNGKDFRGRPLTVNEARPRERRDGGGGGGGFGGDRGGFGGGGGDRGGRGGGGGRERRW